MRASLSVVIPTLNTAETLVETVEPLFEGLGTGLIRELIISDGGSEDMVGEIAEELGARLITGAPGRGGQLGRGAAEAKADWFLFLHADTHLLPGWSRAVVEHMTTQPGKAAAFRLSFRASGFSPRFVAGWANLRSRLFGLPYGDQGLLISRTLYDQIGGYQDIPLMEDVAVARALKGRLVLLEAGVATGAERFLAQGWYRRGARNLILLAFYFAGVSPVKLVRLYQR